MAWKIESSGQTLLASKIHNIARTYSYTAAASLYIHHYPAHKAMKVFPKIGDVPVWTEPPDGYHVNFTNPHKDTALLYASSGDSISCLVSFLLMGIHFYVASFVTKNLSSRHCKSSLVYGYLLLRISVLILIKSWPLLDACSWRLHKASFSFAKCGASWAYMFGKYL